MNKKLLILLGLLSLVITSNVFAANGMRALPDGKMNDEEDLSMALVKVEEAKDYMKSVQSQLKEAEKDPEISAETLKDIRDLLSQYERLADKWENVADQIERRVNKWQRGRSKFKKWAKSSIREGEEGTQKSIDEITEILKDPAIQKNPQLKAFFEGLKATTERTHKVFKKIDEKTGQWGKHGKGRREARKERREERRERRDNY